jgi:Fe2+ transport system protein FeoA
VPLTELAGGCRAKVRVIRGGKAAVRRLRDMGIIPEMMVTIIRKSPLGGPVELEVCGTKLALGRGIAEKVLVEVS